MTMLTQRLALSILLTIVCLGFGNSTRAEEPIKVLIVSGFDHQAHAWEESTRAVQAIVEKDDRFDVTISFDKEVFASPQMSDTDVAVLLFGFWEESDPSDAAKAGLLKYVNEGGGVVALHFACSSFQEWDEYAKLIGRVWKKGVGGHGPYGEFEVDIVKADHPVTSGMTDFKTEDELYAKLTGDEEIEVLASAYSDWSKKVEPIVFVKKYGEGRVVQNVLGHGLDAKQNASYQKLLLRGIEWAATGKVSAD